MQSAPRAIPIVAAPVDALRQGGAIAFKQSALSPHPAQAAQASQLANEWGTEQRLAALAYGAHAAMERRMDRAALSQIQRLPGGPGSSHAMLDAWLGRDGAVGWEDVLHGALAGRGRAQELLFARVESPPPLTRHAHTHAHRSAGAAAQHPPADHPRRHGAKVERGRGGGRGCPNFASYFMPICLLLLLTRGLARERREVLHAHHPHPLAAALHLANRERVVKNIQPQSV